MRWRVWLFVTGIASAAHAQEEVRVRAVKPEVGQKTISAAEIREMPGAFGDPFRAVEALPGVSPMVSGLGYFFIRGAPPNNNGYFIDGIRVPLLFHLGLGQGVLHPGIVERVDFFPGGAPARYGGFAGAIIAGQTRAPSSELRGEASVRIIDAGALVESPIGERGTALVAGRYGYPGPILGLVSSDLDIGYWDYQARTSWKLGDRDRIGLFAFGSHDRIASGSPKLEESFLSDFHRIDLRHDHDFQDGHMRIAATLGHDRQGAQPVYLTNKSAAVRLEIEQRVNDDVRIRGGAGARVEGYKLEQGPAPTDEEEPIVPSGVDPAPTNVTGGVHADAVWRLSPRVEIVPGARVDVYSGTRRDVTTTVPAIDPRLSSRVMLASGVFWHSTFALAHQYPALRVGPLPAMVASGSGFAIGSKKLQTVAQASQGIEVMLPADISVTGTGFLSGWSGLTDLSAHCIQLQPPTFEREDPPRPPDPYVCVDDRQVHGRSFGFELMVRRPLSKRLSGWLSYTLSRSTREARYPRLDGSANLVTVPSEFDRTHVLNAILAYDFGRRWRAGSRFVFYTGQPYSKLAGSVPTPPYNAFRTPAFFRVDVRLEKRWPLGSKGGSIAFVFEAQNVTLSKETSTLGLDCEGELNDTMGTNNCKIATFGPITIPSIGVEAFF